MFIQIWFTKNAHNFREIVYYTLANILVGSMVSKLCMYICVPMAIS